MEKEDVKNKEDFICYILQLLHERVHHVKFGNLFMEISPSGGIDSFRNLLDELHENGLVTKQEMPGESVPLFPHLRTIDMRYGISLKGMQYLKEH